MCLWAETGFVEKGLKNAYLTADCGIFERLILSRVRHGKGMQREHPAWSSHFSRSRLHLDIEELYTTIAEYAKGKPLLPEWQTESKRQVEGVT
jgi:hypothetical protein